MNDFYKIGRIGRPHGINGEVIMMFTDDVFDQANAEYLMLDIDGLLVPFFMEEYRFRSNETALVKFEDINSKEQAQRITNCDIYFPRQSAEEIEHYSWDMLVGYEVIALPDRKSIGKIDNVDTTTENYLFEVIPNTEQDKSADDTILIPATDEWVEDIDHEKRTIIMNLPEGLIE